MKPGVRGSGFAPLLSLVFFLIGWHFLATHLIAELPTLLDTAQTFLLLVTKGEPVPGRTLQAHTFASLTRVLVGAGIGFSLAIPLGMVMGRSVHWERFLSPMVEILRPIGPASAKG